MTREEKNAYMREYMKKWKKEHPNKQKEYAHKSYMKNRDKILEKNRKYREEHKEEIKEMVREYNKKHPEVMKKSYEKFKKTHNWSKYCCATRKKRMDKLREQGILNPTAIINHTGHPIRYKEGYEPKENEEI